MMVSQFIRALRFKPNWKTNYSSSIGYICGRTWFSIHLQYIFLLTCLCVLYVAVCQCFSLTLCSPPSLSCSLFVLLNEGSLLSNRGKCISSIRLCIQLYIVSVFDVNVYIRVAVFRVARRYVQFMGPQLTKSIEC